MDPSLSFIKHCNYVSDRIDKRNNMLKALAGSSCGQEETLLLTYALLLLLAFRDLWKEWGDSNFHIFFSTELPVPSQAAGVGTFSYLRDVSIYLKENSQGKSIASYAAPIWSTNARDSSFKKIQTAQNAALRTAAGTHKMASIDNLHQESLTLKVKDHSDMLSA